MKIGLRAACAALALHGGDPSIGDGKVRWAIERAAFEVREVLRRCPVVKLETVAWK